MSPAGRAIATFSWQPSALAQQDAAVAEFDDKLALCNWLISTAAKLNITIYDGRPHNSGLSYCEDVAHLLEAGTLPAKFAELQAERLSETDDRSVRFQAYRYLAVKAKGEHHASIVVVEMMCMSAAYIPL